MKHKEDAIFKVAAILKGVSANNCFMLNYLFETAIFSVPKITVVQHRTRLNVAPNMADPINLKENRRLP